MKTKLFSSLLLLVASGAFAASDAADATKQLQAYPKNLARQNIGSNLFLYNPANQAYVPTEAAAAWLDDDVATGWPPMLGQHYYLVSLSHAELLTNFAILAQSASGTVSLYAGDEPSPPSAKSWAPLAKNLAVDTINGVKMTKPFSRFAKYLLIETNLTDSGPWYSLYLYGEKAATNFTLEKRAQTIDTRSVFGPYVNNQEAFNASSLYAKAQVSYCNAGEGFSDWQKLIDDNPESAINVAPSTTDAGVVIKYDAAVGIQRISVLTTPAAKGKLEFFLTDAGAAPTASTAGSQSQYVKVANGAEPSKSLAGLTPAATLVFTGASSHASADFATTSATSMMVRWTPDDGKQALPIREINSFDDVSLTAYQLSGSPEAIAENTTGSSRTSTDGKENLGDGKDGKGLLPPVSELLPSRTPFVPGSLGFPTNLPANTPPVASLPPRRPPTSPPTPLSP